MSSPGSKIHQTTNPCQYQVPMNSKHQVQTQIEFFQMSKAWVQVESKRKDKGKTTMIEENSINDTWQGHIKEEDLHLCLKPIYPRSRWKFHFAIILILSVTSTFCHYQSKLKADGLFLPTLSFLLYLYHI